MVRTTCGTPRPSRPAPDPEISKSARKLNCFVDEFLIEKSEGLRRTVHSWQKHPENPILRAEKAWESGGAIVLIYGSVLFDEEDGIFKMWYYSAAQQAGQSKHQEHMCYATSEDGIHWTRPRLGIHDFNGARDNNICLVSEASDIETYGAIKDPGDPDPGRRYKMMFWEKRSDGRTGVWTATSPDGLHWTRAAEPAADRAQLKRAIPWRSSTIPGAGATSAS